MPITGPASYLPTADEFIAHWKSADLMLGAAGPIKLADGVTLALFTTLRNTLETQRADTLRLKELTNTAPCTLPLLCPSA